jgi:DNA-binding NarL/FixJ family response regulator
MQTQISPLRGFTVVLHDENAFFRRALRTLINGEGLREIIPSEEFSTLSDKVWALRPDILVLSWEPGDQKREVLLDLIRSGHGGFDTCMRVLATTNCGRSDHVRRLAKAGVHGVLLKPFNRKAALIQLSRMATKITEARQAQDQDFNESMPRGFVRPAI